MDRHSILQEQIATEASDWFARLQDAEVSAQERNEFSLWLLRSPDHIREYLAVMHAWSTVGGADTEEFSIDTLVSQANTAQSNTEQSPPNIVPIRVRAFKSSLPAKRGELQSGGSAKILQPKKYWQLAAAVTLCLSAVLWFVIAGNPGSHLVTAIGEQRSMTLADGSIVSLNTDSEVRINLTSEWRSIRLLKGEARFTVAKDRTRPFVVTTDSASVRALGTVFNVRKMEKQTAVAVLGGRVEVSSREVGVTSLDAAGEATLGKVPKSMELAAGQRAAVTAAGSIVANAGPPLERVAEWTNRLLVFREEALGDLVAEVNRYHKKPLRISDTQLVDLRISGTFSANDLDSLIEYLQSYHGVHASRTADGDILLSRRVAVGAER